MQRELDKSRDQLQKRSNSVSILREVRQKVIKSRTVRRASIGLIS